MQINKETIEQAKMFSALFQENGGAENTDKMLKMLEIFQMVSSLQAPIEERPAAAVSFDAGKVLDESANIQGLNALKSAVPYLDPRYRKNIWFMIKLIEIHKLLDSYGNAAMQLHKQIPGGINNWRREMLLAVRPHMSTENKQIADLLLRFLDINEIMSKLEEMRNVY